jgi:uncharacterized RDD family membrane protein YckC
MTDLPAVPDTNTISHAGLTVWRTTPVAPWRRYGARALDIIIGGTFGFLLFGFAFGLMAPTAAESFFSLFEGPFGRIFDLICTVIMASLINALLMGTIGTTLGKAIFGIRVLNADNSRLNLVVSSAREFKVWVFGFGCGIPLVSLFTMIAAFKKLKDTDSTSWDLNRFAVTYRPSGSTQSLLNAFGIGLIVIGRIGLKYLQTLPA